MAEEKQKMKLKLIKAEKPEGKKYYKVYAEGHKSYFTCWSESIHQYIGKEQEFDVTKREMQGENGPWYAYTINLPGSESSGFQKSGKSWSGKSMTEIVTEAKCKVLYNVKDLVLKQVDREPNIPWEIVLDRVKRGYEVLLPLLDLDKVQETPKTAPQATTVAYTGPKLKPALITMLKVKTQGWSMQDIIDTAFVLSMDIPHNVESGEIYWDRLSEEQANKFLDGIKN